MNHPHTLRLKRKACGTVLRDHPSPTKRCNCDICSLSFSLRECGFWKVAPPKGVYQTVVIQEYSGLSPEEKSRKEH